MEHDMITNDTEKKDPKTELQQLANWIVVEGLKDQPACTSEQWDAVLEMFEEDCETVGACSATLLINTTSQMTRAVLAATPQKAFPAPPLPLSKLRPKA
jgi:hypothetical protein